MNKFIKVIFVLLCCNTATAQGIDPRLGYDLFKATNYLDATYELKKHLKVDPLDSKALFHIGLCYLNTNIDKGAAVTYFEKCLSTGKADKECLYYLGVAYSHQYNFDKAIEKLQEYLKSPGKSAEDAQLKIKAYEESKELYKSSVDVSFENLGDKINSKYPDYNPFSSKDEKIIVFTSRREDGKGKKEFDGYFPADIFITKYDGVRFMTTKPASLNSNFDESCVGIQDDGSEMFLYFDNITEAGEIYFSEQVSGGFSKKKKIAEGVNDLKSIETAASISSDLNTLFFASNREGGKGGLDLYMTRKLPNGAWASPQNISLINTPGHEDFPTLAADGQTLYFCSDGLGGLGGYDLYKSIWDPETNEWSKPINLGYPINTTYDDKVISFTEDGVHAYVSQVREDGFGDFDIYRITFNEKETTPVMFSIAIQDQTNSQQVDEAVIVVYDNKDDLIGEYKSVNGSKIFMALLPGEYLLEIESEGYGLLEQKLKVTLGDLNKGMVNLTYKLSK